MTHAEQLMKLEGAACVGGDLLWKHKVLGSFRGDEFLITEEGTKALNVEDVVVKEVKPAAKTAVRPAAKTAAKSKTDKPAETSPVAATDDAVDADLANDIDEMLGE